MLQLQQYVRRNCLLFYITRENKRNTQFAMERRPAGGRGPFEDGQYKLSTGRRSLSPLNHNMSNVSQSMRFRGKYMKNNRGCSSA